MMLIQRFLILLCAFALLQACNNRETITICFNSNATSVTQKISEIENLLNNSGYEVRQCQDQNSHTKNVVTFSKTGKAVNHLSGTKSVDDIRKEGYVIKVNDNYVQVISIDDKGANYGITDLIDQLKISNNFNEILPKLVNPAFSFRAIKFNLPWSPYRPGPATDLHMDICRDLKFWEAFLDMMAENRFSALTLWNTHPFPYMIKANNYPKATPFNDEELKEWKSFWKSLFKMAKIRGIETYIINWNIVVSPEFAENYGAKIHFDRSELVKKYTRESVTQTINEYEDLTGIGVTLADWMGNWGEEKMTSAEKEAWIKDTFVDGIKAANRKVKFIHRAVLAGDPKEMRKVIDYADLPEKTNVEVKFNWSHGHSTPNLSLTHSNDNGTIMREFWDPKPGNYFISWMIRNEDFFVLRWGDPDFIRSHIATNNHEYVDGYFVGSEGYIPAADYSSANPGDISWKYAFQKQWLFYHLWGRLLYNPAEDNEIFSTSFEQKYPGIEGNKLLRAFTLASKVPELIASYYKGTWDFTLYSEGFLAPWQNGFDDSKSPFISLEELINHETLDQRYISIHDYSAQLSEEKPFDQSIITPLQLADQISENGIELEILLNELSTKTDDQTLNSEMMDLETWQQLGFYFADKLRGGVAFKNYQSTGNQVEKKQAIEYMRKCIEHWKQIIVLTENRYQAMPYVSMGHHEQKWPDFKEFHWKHFLKDVEADLEWVIQTEPAL